MHGGVAVDAILADAYGMAAVRVTADARRTRVECRLPVASKTGDALTCNQQLVVYRAMWIVTGVASVTYRIVLENEWSLHFLVASKTSLVVAKQHRTAGGSNITSVHIVTIRTKHFAFRDGMVMLEHKLALYIEMA